MSDEKITRLVYKLAANTSNGSLGWEETEREGVFQVSFSNSTVRIHCRESRQNRGEDEYVISIHNGIGIQVEEISDESVRGVENSFALFKNMYELARRKAIGLDQTIDSLLDDLDSGFF